MSIKSSFPSIRPSLSLDFAKSRQLDPRLSFARAHTGNIATYTDENGLIKYAGSDQPRFDHRISTRTNLFLYSEDLGQSNWFKGRVIVTNNATTAPDGSTTADLLTENNTSTGEHYVGQTGFDYISGVTYTWSWFVKPNGRDNVYCKVYTNFNVAQAIINLPSGSIYHATTEQFDNITFEPYPDGWFRVSFTKAATSTGQGDVLIGFTNSATTYSYLGDGTSGMYVWGVQVEASSTLTDYMISTSQNGTDVEIKSLGLLIEQNQTNLIKYGTDFSSGNWSLANGSISTNQTTSPSGETDAALLTQSGSTTAYLNQGGITWTSGTQYTFSAYVKKYSNSDVNQLYILAYGTTFHSDGTTHCRVKFNLDSVSANITGGLVDDYSITDAGDGWRRIRATFTAYATETKSHQFIRFADPGATSNVYVWGYQVEAGPHLTSFIPTTAAAVTRPADNVAITGTKFTDIYNDTEGTIGVKATINHTLPAATYGGIFGAGGPSQKMNFILLNPANSQGAYISNTNQSPNVGAGLLSDYIPGETFTTLSSYIEDDFDCASSAGPGVSLKESTISGALPSGMTQFRIGSHATTTGNIFGNQTISKITYYPTKLSNAELLALIE